MSGSRVVVERCGSYAAEEVRAVVELVVNRLGGWGQYVHSRQRVLLKPNLISGYPAEAAATTHPMLVDAVLLALRAMACEVVVGDSPAFGSARGVARKCGILQMCRQHDVPLIELAHNRPSLQTPHANQTGWALSRQLEEFDVVINLPKLKVHNQLRLTTAVKNLFGCVGGKVKAWRHLRSGDDYGWFAAMLLATADRVGAGLTLVDGIVGMHGSGPTGGQPKDLGVVLGGVDPVAVDRVIAAMLGMDPQLVPVLAEAHRQGRPGAELEQIEIVGVPLKSIEITGFRHVRQLSPVSFDPIRVGRSVIRHWWRKLREET